MTWVGGRAGDEGGVARKARGCTQRAGAGGGGGAALSHLRVGGCASHAEGGIEVDRLFHAGCNFWAGGGSAASACSGTCEAEAGTRRSALRTGQLN